MTHSERAQDNPNRLYKLPTELTPMPLSRVFYEPFYTLSDFDRLFDEAFNARTSNNAPSRTRNQVTEAANSNGNQRLTLRPRYVIISYN